jgi:hypothetical protein
MQGRIHHLNTLGYLQLTRVTGSAVTRFAGGAGDVATMSVSLTSGEVVSFFAYGVTNLALWRDLVPAHGLFADCIVAP